jgi:hypothetical protein
MVINYCLIDDKNNYKFIKILDRKSNDIKSNDINISLDCYINENKIINNYSIDVISVRFIKGKKPIIKII